MSAAKQRGTKWESAVRDYLNGLPFGFKVYRPAQSGFNDLGDLHGLEPFTLQLKDWRETMAAIREGLDGAQTQRDNAGTRWGVAIVKRARKPTADAYVVMRLEDFAEVVDAARRGLA